MIQVTPTPALFMIQVTPTPLSGGSVTTILSAGSISGMHRPRMTAGRVAVSAALAATSIVAVATVVTWNPWRLVVLDRLDPFGGNESVQQTVDSAGGTHRVVVTKWAAAIDPAWSVYVEDRRGLLSRRREIWRSVEHISPASVAFTGPTTVVVNSSNGEAFSVAFDAASLAPTPFHCLSPGYC